MQADGKAEAFWRVAIGILSDTSPAEAMRKGNRPGMLPKQALLQFAYLPASARPASHHAREIAMTPTIITLIVIGALVLFALFVIGIYNSLQRRRIAVQN